MSVRAVGTYTTQFMHFAHTWATAFVAKLYITFHVHIACTLKGREIAPILACLDKFESNDPTVTDDLIKIFSHHPDHYILISESTIKADLVLALKTHLFSIENLLKPIAENIQLQQLIYHYFIHTYEQERRNIAVQMGKLDVSKPLGAAVDLEINPEIRVSLEKLPPLPTLKYQLHQALSQHRDSPPLLHGGIKNNIHLQEYLYRYNHARRQTKT